MKFFKIQYVIIASLCAVFASNSNAMSLKEALAIAYQNNPELKAERSRQKGTDEQKAAALGDFLPSISASYSKTRTEQEYSSIEDKTTTDRKALTYQHNLFNGGGGYYGMKRANDLINSGRQRLKAVEQDVMLDAISAYIDLVRTRNILELNKNNELVLTEQLSATRERFELGETTKTDVAQAESRLALARSNRINAEGDIKQIEAEFERVYMVAPPQNIGMPKNMPIIPESFDAALNSTIENNPTLKIAQLDSEASKKSVKIARSDLLPSVDIQGQISEDSNLSARSGGGDLDTTSLGLTVSIPLFQRGVEYAAVRQARRAANENLHRADAARNAAVNSVTVAWKDVRTTLADIEANKTAVKAAKIALEGVEQEQDIGSRTVLDVLDAEQELFNAEVSLVIAKRNSVISHYNLLSAMGSLTAEKMGLKTQIYDPEEYYDKLNYKIIGF